MFVEIDPNGPDLQSAVCDRADTDSPELPVQGAELDSGWRPILPLLAISTLGRGPIQDSKRRFHFRFGHCI